MAVFDMIDGIDVLREFSHAPKNLRNLCHLWMKML